MLCFGHRGARGHEPENTLLSIAKALELGAGWIEIDVYAVENALVVIHDDRLERTTNGTGSVSDRPLAYLRALDAGKGQRIPLLDEVFDLVGQKAGINVELKGPGTADPVAGFIAKRLTDGWTYDRILVSSFDLGQLERIHKLNPNIRIGALFDACPIPFAECERTLAAYSIHPSLACVDAALIQDAHMRGMKVFVFTVNSPEEIARLRTMGVDGVFSDFPERVQVSSCPPEQ